MRSNGSRHVTAHRRGHRLRAVLPLGDCTPLQSTTLSAVADGLGVTPMQVALAWLLQRTPNIPLIPDTSSIGHLRENLVAYISLGRASVVVLDQIAAGQRVLH